MHKKQEILLFKHRKEGVLMKLEFGTAGMRGVIGDHESQLNVKHVQRVIEGFAKSLLKKYGKRKKITIVIGRDNRNQSKQFAEAAAAVLNYYKINVYYGREITPTPLVSYLVKHKKAQGAVNITASHNTKEYNGIKLYNEFGYQILPYEVDEIVEQFEDYNLYPKKHFKFDKSNKLFLYAEDDLEKDLTLIDKYKNDLVKIASKNADFSNLKVAFSPLHGTGAKYAKHIFRHLKVNAVYDEEVMKEDKEFTFIANPNPESKSAYERLIKIAKENNADILMVTDPDSDRVGLGVKDKNGEYQLLTGNETAILIFDYLIKNKKTENKYLIHSFVSTTLPATISKENNVAVYETATGFKWIGELIKRLKQNDKNAKLLFGFEESYGSLLDENMAADKDALQSLVILSQIASESKTKGRILLDDLEDIYKKYGYVVSKSFTIDLDPSNPHQLNDIKHKFRNLNLHNSKLIDFSNGNKEVAPSDMLKLEFMNNGLYDWMALRPSGTEPKIKFYIFATERQKDWANDRFGWMMAEIEKTFK
ncbi:hypothetical protein CJJ23_00590 [Mycoplasmopsis agassizii]|uniref:Phosphomannomutase n=2 Tax=Mycoplasmopsis agassizii TaxID=33922 RepID=A0A269TLH9_9BACT|nr:hypothetical protein CJJ23_00590 [Mycoplasmopsis agassizii]